MRRAHGIAMGMLADRIIYIDAEAIVIDKPAGLPVDRPRAGGPSVSAMLHDLRLGFHRTPALLHRLDRDTSGCLLLARNPAARIRFQAAFEQHRVEKLYLALLDGEVAEDVGVVDMALGKISTAEEGWRMVPDEAGKPARSPWRVIARRGGRTLVGFAPETGRTHQIRVHAASGLGVPIVGDPVYGKVPGGTGRTMLLHAAQLTIPRDKKPAIVAAAPLPPNWGDWREAWTPPITELVEIHAP
jgi:tRNA pseudouridine32 synthase / 23S rRNA pseudouridine746 synthase